MNKLFRKEWPPITAHSSFLLPICPVCGGSSELRSVEPHPVSEDKELRTYVCERCVPEHTFAVEKSR